MNDELLTDTLRANIAELREFFFEKSAPDHPGEHPHCRELEIAIEKELDTWDDKKLKAFGDSVDIDKNEFLFGALCDLSDTRTVLKPKFD